MTNGQLFIKENPTVEIKINGSCVWIYFDGVNHYTMPVKWWDKEIGLFEDIKAEIQEHTQRYTLARESGGIGQVDWSDYLIKADDMIAIIDKHIGKEQK